MGDPQYKITAVNIPGVPVARLLLNKKIQADVKWLLLCEWTYNLRIRVLRAFNLFTDLSAEQCLWLKELLAPLACT